MIRTRFAPSPTGYLHIGGVRTALYAWLFAKHQKGEFLLRIEDTDTKRSTQESVDSIVNGLGWLGLRSDQPIVYQSSRSDLYQAALSHLESNNKSYRCDCSVERLDTLRKELLKKGEKPRYDGHCRDKDIGIGDRNHVIRFINPDEGKVVINDLVKGQIEYDNRELDDLIIQRSNGTPTYNFCVAVDDTSMKISHVVRGDDHLNNTPRQINIIEALGETVPIYAHLPMIHGEDNNKLSKRHGAVSVLDFKLRGYTPEALLNYIARLGWSHGDQELFTIEELIEHFDLGRVSSSPSIFDYKKLDWVSQQHFLKMSEEDLVSSFCEFYPRDISVHDIDKITMFVSTHKERAKNLHELVEKSVPYFSDEIVSDLNQQSKHLIPETKELFIMLLSHLNDLENWDAHHILEAVKTVSVERGVKLGALAQPLRVAVVGSSASPGIGETLALVGKINTLKRIQDAIDYIANLDNNVN